MKEKENEVPFSPSLSLKRTPPPSSASSDKSTKGGTSTKTPALEKKNNITKDEEKRLIQRLVSSKKARDESRLEYATYLTQELSNFIHGRQNMHTEARHLVSKVLAEVLKVKYEFNELKKIIEAKEEELQELKKCTSKETTTKRTRSNSSPDLGASQTGTKKQKNKSDVASHELCFTPKPAGSWVQVTKQKIRERKPPEPKGQQGKKTIKSKSDAMVIGAKDANSYADILKKIKNDPSLKDMGSKVSRVRRTRTGELLLQFNSDESARSAAFKDLVEKVVGEDAIVKALSQEVLVECRNLDEVTTAEELREALVLQFSLENPQSFGVIKLRKAYGSTQTGSIKVPVAVANKMTEVGKVKVGWSVCQLRIPQRLLRCYKCLGFGHIASICKSSVDRKNACWKCGIEGHKSGSCVNQPKCCLCKDNIDHMAGSIKCKAYQDAMSKRGWK